MSILIKGMEMPTSRPICVVIDAAGQARRYDLNNDRYADKELFEAVHVPEHGDLISRSALIVDLMDRGIEGIQTDDWHEIQQAIMDAQSQGGCGGNGKATAIYYYDTTYKTNYDRIISKTPEELAEWLTLCLWGINREVPFLLDCNVDRWLDWLKQEATE